MRAAAKDDGGLPSVYQAVEYIMSNGTQYIKTGILTDDNNEISAEFQITSAAAANNNALRNYVVGGAPETSRNQYCYARTHFRGWGGKYSSEYISANTSKHTLTMNKTVFKRDGETVYTVIDHKFNTPTEIYAFANNNGTDTASGFSQGLKIYSLKISKNGEPLRDFIPCYRKDDPSIIGMYDAVTKTFFANAGTGTFVKGNDI